MGDAILKTRVGGIIDSYYFRDPEEIREEKNRKLLGAKARIPYYKWGNHNFVDDLDKEIIVLMPTEGAM